MRGITSAFGSARGERIEALLRRPIEQRRAVDVQAIEEVDRERQLGAHALDVELAAEAAHRHLERQRRAVGGERDGLAVEDQLVRGQRMQRLDDLGRRRGDVLQRARVDLDLAAALCTCTRAPSTFHSSAAVPSLAIAAAMSSAGVASIGCTGRCSATAKRARPLRLASPSTAPSARPRRGGR
jgi:hypothetical protein